MSENETTPPLNEAEQETLDGVLGEVTSDQVAGMVREMLPLGNITPTPPPVGEKCVLQENRAFVLTLADLYATADPSFDREEFLKRCGV